MLAPQLRKTSKAAWPATREVLVDDYKFSAAFVDGLHAEGRLAANRFRDLQFLSPQSAGVTSLQVYPLIDSVFTGDGIFLPQKPFTLGSGSDFLVVVERPIDVMAFWESTPADLRSCLKVVAVAVDSEPIIWAQLQKEHPAAALVDARSGTVLDAIRTKQQEVFPDLRVISPHPFETWAAAWRRQFDDKPSKDAFRTVQELLIATLTPGMPMGLR